MMKAALVSVVALAVLAAGGCARNVVVVDDIENFEVSEGLKVSIKLPSRRYKAGDVITVSVAATNTTDDPIQIHSPTGAPVLVRISRQSYLASEQVRVYPRTATTNIRSWTLPAGRRETYTLRVPVEPDWPVNEWLHLSAELNGYGQLAPALLIQVRSP
jgi:hypothetical protein